MHVREAILRIARGPDYARLCHFIGFLNYDSKLRDPAFPKTKEAIVANQLNKLFTAVDQLVQTTRSELMEANGNTQVVIEQTIQHHLMQEMPIYVSLLLTQKPPRPAAKSG